MIDWDVEGKWVSVRGPARAVGVKRRGLGNEHPTYAKVLSLARDAFARYGPGCKERDYQLGIFNSSWFTKSNIQIKMERYVNINHYYPPCLGRVDLEVAGRFVFELKVIRLRPWVPTKCNVEKDRLQLEMYLQAYAFNKHQIDRAALIYFTPTGVVVVEVDCDWSFYTSLVPLLFFF